MKAAAALFASLLALPAAGAEDVPFITTPDAVTLEMLRLAGTGPRDRVLDLGSGDGRIVITAAKRFGARGTGVEIVPDLVAKSRENAKAAGVAARARFLEQDLFATDLTQATVLTMYLLPDVNLQLRPAILKLRPGTRVVSHDWDMGDWAPERTVTVPVPDKAIGLAKSSRVHLWIVPARLAGAWCGEGRHRGWSLAFTQAFQQAQGTLLAPGARDAAVAFGARIEGARVEAVAAPDGKLALRAGENGLRVTQATGRFGRIAGVRFRMREGEACPS